MAGLGLTCKPKQDGHILLRQEARTLWRHSTLCKVIGVNNEEVSGLGVLSCQQLQGCQANRKDVRGKPEVGPYTIWKLPTRRPLRGKYQPLPSVQEGSAFLLDAVLRYIILRHVYVWKWINKSFLYPCVQDAVLSWMRRWKDQYARGWWKTTRICCTS